MDIYEGLNYFLKCLGWACIIWALGRSPIPSIRTEHKKDEKPDDKRNPDKQRE